MWFRDIEMLSTLSDEYGKLVHARAFVDYFAFIAGLPCIYLISRNTHINKGVFVAAIVIIMAIAFSSTRAYPAIAIHYLEWMHQERLLDREPRTLGPHFFPPAQFPLLDILRVNWLRIREEAIYAPLLNLSRAYNEWTHNTEYIKDKTKHHGWIMAWQSGHDGSNPDWLNYMAL